MIGQRLSLSRRAVGSIVSALAALGWAWLAMQVAPGVASGLKTAASVAVFFGGTFFFGATAAFALLGRVRVQAAWQAQAEVFQEEDPTLCETDGAAPANPADEELY